METAGQDVTQLTKSVAVQRGDQLLFLIANFPGGAVPGVGDRADQILPLLFDPFQTFFLLVELVQHSGESGPALQLRRSTILSNRKKCEILCLPIEVDKRRMKVVFLHGTNEPFQLVQQPGPARRAQDIQTNVGAAARLLGQFPAD